MRFRNAADPVRELLAHGDPGGVDRCPVDHRVGPGHVHDLEDARVERGVVGALPAVNGAGEIDEDRLAGLDVADDVEVQGVEGDRFRRRDELGSAHLRMR